MSETKLATVMFGCDRCKIDRVKVEVRERMAGESLKQFMDRAVIRCMICHKARSPRCGAKKMNLYVPVGAEQVGDAGEPTAERKKEIGEHFCPTCHNLKDQCICATS